MTELRKALYIGDGERLEVRELGDADGSLELVEYYDDDSGSSSVLIASDLVQGLIRALAVLGLGIDVEATLGAAEAQRGRARQRARKGG